MGAGIILKNREAELDMEINNNTVVRFMLDEHRYIDVKQDGDEITLRTDGSMAVFPVSSNCIKATVAQ